MKRAWSFLTLLALIPAGCSDGGGSQPDAGADADAAIEAETPADTAMEDPAPEAEIQPEVIEDPLPEEAIQDVLEEEGPPPVGSCPTYGYDLVPGVNAGFMNNGKERSFTLVLPDTLETAPGPWPVIFVWHGYGGDAQWSVSLIADLVSDPDFPFIGVAPESLALEIPVGFEWDMLLWDPEDDDDVSLFDAVLACLDEAFGVDPDRVHSMGMSAGAIMTDLLVIARGDVLASAVSYSGAFFSDPAQMIDPRLTWPPYDLTNKLTVLIAWGGESDVYAPYIDFNVTALASITYLNDNGHDVIACNHGGGHTVPADLYSPKAVEFLRDHPMGSHPTPYAADGLPADFPAYCEIHQAP